MIDLETVNSWNEAEAHDALLRCCGARSWATRMAARRPYAGERELLDAARVIWRALPRAAWLEAFAAHPRIGDLDALKKKFATTAAWAASEQAGVAGASDATITALAEANKRYEARFGHIFIVCAGGKSAAEMLVLLEQRLQNDPEEEIRIAAAQQEMIMLLRLQKITP